MPLRVITALKEGADNTFATLNTNLSMFLTNNFSANGEHAIISDIGAWKDDVPVMMLLLTIFTKDLKDNQHWLLCQHLPIQEV